MPESVRTSESVAARRRENQWTIQHRMTGSPEYKSWQAMKRRCCNPRDKDYPNYGGRGIGVCAEWLDSFDSFLRDMGPRPPGTTLERSENTGPYCATNCVWATSKKQNRNRRGGISITYDGHTRNLAEWCELLGLDYGNTHRRLRRFGWTVERAFSMGRSS